MAQFRQLAWMRMRMRICENSMKWKLTKSHWWKRQGGTGDVRGEGFKGHWDEKKSAQIKLSSAAGKIGPVQKKKKGAKKPTKKKVSGSAATKGRHRRFSIALLPFPSPLKNNKGCWNSRRSHDMEQCLRLGLGRQMNAESWWAVLKGGAEFGAVGGVRLAKEVGGS